MNLCHPDWRQIYLGQWWLVPVVVGWFVQSNFQSKQHLDCNWLTSNFAERKNAISNIAKVPAFAIHAVIFTMILNIMSIFIYLSFSCFCHKSYILEQQGHFWGGMSKFWSLLAADSDSEDVWLLDGLYVLSSSRSYKDENLNQLFACKRKYVVRLYYGLFMFVYFRNSKNLWIHFRSV